MRWFTAVEAARQIGVSPTTIRERVRSGELVAANVGSVERPRLRISGESLDAFMRDRQVA